MGVLKKQEITVVTVGGANAAYGQAWSPGVLWGEIKHVVMSGAGLGTKGYYTVTPSGTDIKETTFAGSRTSSAWTWERIHPPMTLGTNARFSHQTEDKFPRSGGAATGPYSADVLEITVSGTNAGSLFMKIYYDEMRF